MADFMEDLQQENNAPLEDSLVAMELENTDEKEKPKVLNYIFPKFFFVLGIVISVLFSLFIFGIMYYFFFQYKEKPADVITISLPKVDIPKIAKEDIETKLTKDFKQSENGVLMNNHYLYKIISISYLFNNLFSWLYILEQEFVTDNSDQKINNESKTIQIKSIWKDEEQKNCSDFYVLNSFIKSQLKDLIFLTKNDNNNNDNNNDNIISIKNKQYKIIDFFFKSINPSNLLTVNTNTIKLNTIYTLISKELFSDFIDKVVNRSYLSNKFFTIENISFDGDPKIYLELIGNNLNKKAIDLMNQKIQNKLFFKIYWEWIQKKIQEIEKKNLKIKETRLLEEDIQNLMINLQIAIKTILEGLKKENYEELKTFSDLPSDDQKSEIFSILYNTYNVLIKKIKLNFNDEDNFVKYKNVYEVLKKELMISSEIVQ
jgi:hypothetical protein